MASYNLAASQKNPSVRFSNSHTRSPADGGVVHRRIRRGLIITVAPTAAAAAAAAAAATDVDCLRNPSDNAFPVRRLDRFDKTRKSGS